jgi:hypothetical protein
MSNLSEDNDHYNDDNDVRSSWARVRITYPATSWAVSAKILMTVMMIMMSGDPGLV